MSLKTEKDYNLITTVACCDCLANKICRMMIEDPDGLETFCGVPLVSAPKGNYFIPEHPASWEGRLNAFVTTLKN